MVYRRLEHVHAHLRHPFNNLPERSRGMCQPLTDVLLTVLHAGRDGFPEDRNPEGAALGYDFSTGFPIETEGGRKPPATQLLQEGIDGEERSPIRHPRQNDQARLRLIDEAVEAQCRAVDRTGSAAANRAALSVRSLALAGMKVGSLLRRQSPVVKAYIIERT